MEIYFGENLQKLVKTYGVENYQKRDIFSDLQQYINSDNDKRVCALYGLRRTGKTTLMMQSLLEQNIDDCMLIQCSNEDDTGTLNQALIKNDKYNIVYIDEITKLDNFINTASIFADKYAVLGKKIILSGTDSYALELASHDELYDRCHLFHTTYIPYKEYNRLLGKDLDEYIKYGGTLTDGKTFYNKESNDDYINSAIVQNIERSLARVGRDGEFGILREFYERGEFTSFLQKIIELNNRSFLATTVNRNFKSHDIGSLYDLLLKNKETENMDFSFLKSNEFQDKIRLSLSIKEPLIAQAKENTIKEAKKYLEWADVIYQVPNTNEVIFTQPGLRYSQLENEMEVLKNTKELLQCSSEVRNFIYDKLESDIKGRMLEDIIYYQLAKDKKIASEYNIFKYQTIVDEEDIGKCHREIDVVLTSKKTNNSYWLEVKYSKVQDEHQSVHLQNKTLENKFNEETNTKVAGKIILYRGENLSMSDDIISINASEFLKNPYKYLNDNTPDTFSITKDENLCEAYNNFRKKNGEPLEFMKAVVREYGTDTKQLLNAVDIVSDAENETQEFTAKLLQDTMKTNEYKIFLETEPTKTQEYTK